MIDISCLSRMYPFNEQPPGTYDIHCYTEYTITNEEICALVSFNTRMSEKSRAMSVSVNTFAQLGENSLCICAVFSGVCVCERVCVCGVCLCLCLCLCLCVCVGDSPCNKQRKINKKYNTLRIVGYT